MKPIQQTTIAGAALLLSGASGVFAGVGATMGEQPMGGEEHLSIRAMTDFSSMHAGDSGFLAIEIEVEDGWHTYWPGISDTGYGVTFDIDTPDTVTLGEAIWPTPTRYLQPGDILDHTYEGTETVLIPFTVDDAAPANEVLIFDIAANYLVCDEVCLPGRDSTTATVTIVDTPSDPTRTADHGMIHEIYRDRPRTLDPEADDVRVQWIAKAAALMFRDATRIEFFPSTECTELADPIRDGATDGNRLEIRFTESKDKVLKGRVRVHTPTGTVDYDLNLTPPKG